MSGGNAYRFSISRPFLMADGEVLPLKLDSVPWWMPQVFHKQGVFIGSVVSSGDVAEGFIYLPEDTEKGVFFCTPVLENYEITHFTLSDLKISAESEETTLQLFLGE